MCEEKEQVQEMAERYAKAYADALSVTQEAAGIGNDAHYAALEAMRLAARYQ